MTKPLSLIGAAFVFLAATFSSNAQTSPCSDPAVLKYTPTSTASNLGNYNTQTGEIQIWKSIKNLQTGVWTHYQVRAWSSSCTQNLWLSATYPEGVEYTIFHKTTDLTTPPKCAGVIDFQDANGYNYNLVLYRTKSPWHVWYVLKPGGVYSASLTYYGNGPLDIESYLPSW